MVRQGADLVTLYSSLAQVLAGVFKATKAWMTRREWCVGSADCVLLYSSLDQVLPGVRAIKARDAN